MRMMSFLVINFDASVVFVEVVVVVVEKMTELLVSCDQKDTLQHFH